MMAVLEGRDEPSPAQLREQAAAAASAAAAPPAGATGVVTPPVAPPPPTQAQLAPVPQESASPAPPTVREDTPTSVQAPAQVQVSAAPAAVPEPVAGVSQGAVQASQTASPSAAVTPTAPQVPIPAASEGNPFVQLGQAVRSNRAALEAQVAGHYKFTDEQIQEFHTDPGPFLGKLMARIHLDAVENMFGVMAQQMPVAVSGVMAVERENTRLEDAFFTKWPQLDRRNPQHQQVISQIGRAYVQVNPSADVNARIQNIGAQAIVALNLLPAMQAQVQPQVAPTAAYSPVANGGGAAPPQQRKQLEGWEAFDNEFGSFDS